MNAGWRWFGIAVLVSTVVTACGGGSDPESSPTAPSTDNSAAPPDSAADEFCAALQRVRDLGDDIALSTARVASSAQSGDEEQALTAFKSVADEMEGVLDDVLAAYADAEAVAPDDLQGHVADLAAATEAITPRMVQVLRDADSIDDLEELDTALAAPEIQATAMRGGTAALELDKYTIPNCGFKLSS